MIQWICLFLFFFSQHARDPREFDRRLGSEDGRTPNWFFVFQFHRLSTQIGVANLFRTRRALDLNRARAKPNAETRTYFSADFTGEHFGFSSCEPRRGGGGGGRRRRRRRVLQNLLSKVALLDEVLQVVLRGLVGQRARLVPAGQQVGGHRVQVEEPPGTGVRGPGAAAVEVAHGTSRRER